MENVAGTSLMLLEAWILVLVQLNVYEKNSLLSRPSKLSVIPATCALLTSAADCVMYRGGFKFSTVTISINKCAVRQFIILCGCHCSHWRPWIRGSFACTISGVRMTSRAPALRDAAIGGDTRHAALNNDTWRQVLTSCGVAHTK